MAKKNNTGSCQWVIATDFEQQKVVNETQLPTVDKAGNCLFSCNYKAESPKMTAEEAITSFFSKTTLYKMSDYDFYTYLAPCETTIRGNLSEADTNTSKILGNFAGVFYSSNGDGCKGLGTEVQNDDILRHSSVTGLLAARKNTKIDLRRVQQAIKEINSGKTSLSVLRSESEWLYSAAAEYFEQHPKKQDDR